MADGEKGCQGNDEVPFGMNTRTQIDLSRLQLASALMTEALWQPCGRRKRGVERRTSLRSCR